MYIRKIHITNIRGLDEVDLDLDRGGGQFAGWTVIAGRNGSGKSTLLKAIALAVAGPTRTFSLQSSFVGWTRSGADEGWVRLTLQRGNGDGGKDLPEGVKTSLQWLDREALRATIPEAMRPPSGFLEPLMGYEYPAGTGEKSTDGSVWSPNPRGWFIAGYGAHRRLGSRDEASRNQPPMVARLEGLFDDESTFSEATRWIKNIHALSLDYENRALRNKTDNKPEASESNEARRRKLDQVLDHLLRLLNDGKPGERLLPEGHEVTEINQEGIWVESRGVRLPLDSLGDGYKTVIGLVVDIARHIYECFGHFWVIPARGTGSAAPEDVVLVEEDETHLHANWQQRRDEFGAGVVAPEGVILIDEVEAHLHVEWQQRIGFWLKQHFPFIQFIVTTHSPFICQAADKKGLIRLPAAGSGKRAEHVSDDDFRTIVNGGADDAALTALFGLEHPHSEASEKLRTEVAKLEVRVIRGRATAEDKAELERLSAELPTTGSALVEQADRKLKALG